MPRNNTRISPSVRTFGGKRYHYAGWAKTMGQAKRWCDFMRRRGMPARYYPEAVGFSIWARPKRGNPIGAMALAEAATTGAGFGVGLFGAQALLSKLTKKNPIRLAIRPYRGRYLVTGTSNGRDSIVFNKKTDAVEYVNRVKAGEKPMKVLRGIWRIPRRGK